MKNIKNENIENKKEEKFIIETNNDNILNLINKNIIPNDVLEIDLGDGVFKCNIRAQLSLSERTRMVRYITELCFVDIGENEDEFETYQPEYKVFARNAAIINFFSDAKIPIENGVMENVILNTCLAEKIYNKVNELNPGYIDEILNSADEKVKTKINAVIQMETVKPIAKMLNDTLASLLSKFESVDVNQLNGVLSSLQGKKDGEVIAEMLKYRDSENKQNSTEYSVENNTENPNIKTVKINRPKSNNKK